MNSNASFPRHPKSCGTDSPSALTGQAHSPRRSLLLGGVSAILLGALLAGCSSSPKTTAPRSTSVRPVNPLRLPHDSRDGMLAHVMMALGTPYVYGGASPGGFDCSGLVFYALGQVGHTGLPRSSSQWASRSIEIPRNQLQRGDFVFFNTLGPRYSHMGIYVGGDEFVHAPSSGKVVSLARLSSTYFRTRFIEARTVFA